MSAPKGRLAARKWRIARRLSQLGFLLAFLSGPWFGLWIAKGNLAGSMMLDVLPLSDPFVILQSLVAGHIPATTALLGAAIVTVTYALIGGRVYCSWVCPINPVTDAASWAHRRLNLPKGWQPARMTRLWLMVTVLAVSAATGTVAWEFVNPISLLHRGFLFGIGFGWSFVLAVFLFDLFVSRHGWCGHLCPVGAFYGQLGRKALLRVSARRRAACDNCMDCFTICPEPQVLTPALRGATDSTPLILSPDCTNCGRCIDVCDLDVFRFTHRFDATPAPGRVAPKSRLTEPQP